MASNSLTKNKIDTVTIRMYRGGTGDFYLLLFKSKDEVKFKMMIDCGCIEGSKQYFEPKIDDLIKLTGGEVDLLVVTHEHEDHIIGFKRCADKFKNIIFKKVWLAWTEDDSDPIANDLRQNHSQLDKALQIASQQLTGLVETEYFQKLYAEEEHGELMADQKKEFIEYFKSLLDLNLEENRGLKKGQVKPTMVELLFDWKVIKKDTIVEFLEPGDLIMDLPGAEGIRFFILGPPRDRNYLDLEHRKGSNYDKREIPSEKYFALLSALFAANQDGNYDETNILPFEKEYEMNKTDDSNIWKTYSNPDEAYRTIDHDWLFGAGEMAMRYEASINNTSVAMAVQFEASERVLLLPADAELGNWESWHDGLEWTLEIGGKKVKKNAEYLLNNTVFYKIGHHVSQNGTALSKGLDMMTSPDLTALAPLDFRKIKSNWLNTMPNDLLCEALIRKTEGKFYFTGERKVIMNQIKTDRVKIKKTHEKKIDDLNSPFDGKPYVDIKISG